MIITRRPGQAVFLGEDLLTLTSTGRLFTRWTLHVPPTLTVRKTGRLIAPCRRRGVVYVGLDLGDVLWLADTIEIILVACSAEHARIHVYAPRQILVLRQELVTPYSPALLERSRVR